MTAMKNADLHWQSSVPLNQEFNDPYFSLADGLAETEYVFLKHNLLPDKWKSCENFVIGETGFGTGLNFLVTAYHWLNSSAHSSTLTYFSVEKYPLSKKDLSKAFNHWPQFESISSLLIKQYPDRLPGYHVLTFKESRITLVLMIGDVLPMLKQMQVKVDCWYLDGFSPAKNPEMWSPAVCSSLAELSHEKTSFSTFTASGEVRRNLKTAGFDVKKTAGFGKKREMLYGTFLNCQSMLKDATPWYSLSTVKATKLPEIGIVGGGLAALSCAWMLSKKGVNSTIMEFGDGLANGASGNPAGIVMPRFSLDLNLESQFYISSFSYAIARLNELKSLNDNFSWIQSGVFQFLTERRMARVNELNFPSDFLRLLNQVDASKLAGINLTSGGCFFPQSGYVNPRQLCEMMSEISSNHLSLLTGVNVERLERQGERWFVYSDGKVIGQFDNLIIANGADAERLLKTQSFNLSQCRGQISQISVQKETGNLKVPICDDGYLIPELNHSQVIGATYSFENTSLALSQSDHQENIQCVEKMLGVSLQIKANDIAGRASYRTTTADHLPLVGPVLNEPAYDISYKDIHHGRVHDEYQKAQYQPGLYLTVGHGSRGLVSCFSAAALLTSLICDEPVTMPRDVFHKLHPARFKIRAMKKSPNRR